MDDGGVLVVGVGVVVVPAALETMEDNKYLLSI